ncbi:MAG: two-component system phosphate regulon sensor histidine kinase PhoR [Candidatus Azotimanducaceae bacterium]|jgi:two-component system phosphate regulon sensor histidine kinase PhoR
MLKSRVLWQLYGAFGVMILVSTLVFGVLTSSRVQQDAREQIRVGLFAQASILEYVYRPYLRRGTVMSVSEYGVLGERPDSRITIIDDAGVVLADNRQSPSLMNNHSQRPEILEAQHDGQGDSERYSSTVDQNLLYVAVRVSEGERILGYVRIAVPIVAVEQQLGELRNRIYVSAAVITAFFLVLGFILARGFTRPIVEMTNVASRIARGEYNLRLPSLRHDEIGELALALNNLAQGAQGRIVALTNSRDQIAAVLSGLNEGVIAVNLQQRIVHLNAAARSMLVLGDEPMLDAPLWETIRISEISHAVDTCMREQMTVNATVRRGGKTLELTVIVMRNQETGKASGAIIVLGDFTEMVRLQKIRTDFVANASHELKTPIAAIRGFAETIIDDPEMPDDTRDHFMERVRSQASRLDTIVQDLIHLSRFDSPIDLPADSEINLVALVNQVFKAKSEDALDAGVTIEISLPDYPVEVDGDRGGFEQMVSNLLDNAIKYTRGEGASVALRLTTVGDIAIIEVEDNGIGIADDEQQRIFERFYRIDQARSRDLSRNKGGTGLGLSIVKHVAQSHKGNVSVVSQEGQGTTFTVRIPFNRLVSGHDQAEVDHAKPVSHQTIDTDRPQ